MGETRGAARARGLAQLTGAFVARVVTQGAARERVRMTVRTRTACASRAAVLRRWRISALRSATQDLGRLRAHCRLQACGVRFA